MQNLKFCFSLIALFGIAGIGQAAEISWGKAFEIETDADVDVSNEIVRAVNVVSPDVEEIEVTFPGGTTVNFEPEHTFEFNADLDEEFFSNGNVTGDNTFYTAEGLTTENDELDRILDSHGWAGGGPNAAIAVLELADLTVGTNYQIQLVGAADDRGCCEFRQQQIWDDELEPVTSSDGEELWFGRSNDFDEDDERGPGSVIGTFTADADTQRINIVGTDEFDDGAGNLGNGNDPGMSMYVLSIAGNAGPVGDYNDNGMLDSGDLDLQAAGIQASDVAFDLDGDGDADYDDRLSWVKNLKNTWIGDSNLDGEFNSSDFVAVFQAGLFESGNPATWAQGDWNGDGQFSSSDFVVAFQDGGFELGPRAATASVPEPSSVVLLSLGVLSLAAARRKK